MSELNNRDRRKFLELTALLAGVSLVSRAVAQQPAVQKASKETLKYQDKPGKDGQRCDGCMHFQAPKSCAIVAGDISPKGWCLAWVKKPPK